MSRPAVIVDTNVVAAGLLTDIAQHAIVLAPGVGSSAPEAGDQLLWDPLASKADARSLRQRT